MPTRPPIHGQTQRLEARQQQRRDFDRTRYKTHDRAFYDSQAWQRLRRAVLNAEPLCRECMTQGRVEAATVVDHIKDRRDAPELSLEPSNLRGLCKSCHDRRTAADHLHKKSLWIEGWIRHTR